MQNKKSNIIKMVGGDRDIKLNSDPIFCRNNHRIDYNAINSDNWHKITIHHKGLYNKSQILSRLNHALHKIKFFPVAYRIKPHFDSLLISSCGKVITCLISNGFRLKMSDHNSIAVSFVLNLAPYEEGQINGEDKIYKECLNRLNNLENTSTVKNILNLSNFKKSVGFEDIIIDLNNKYILETICKHLLNKEYKHINGLKLNMNNIMNITPLSILVDLNLKMIDLSNNKITDAFLLRHLKWNLEELYITGNPVNERHLDSKFFQIMPNLIRVNGKEISEISNENISQSLDVNQETANIEEEIFDTKNNTDFDILNDEIIESNIVTDEIKVMPLINQEIMTTIIPITSSNESTPQLNFIPTVVLKSFEKILKPNDINDRFNVHLLIKTNFMHKIIVHHNNICNKEELLIKFHELLPDTRFIPMSYKSSLNEDSFYLSNCEDTLEILCYHKLFLSKDTNSQIVLTVKLNAKKCDDPELDPLLIIQKHINDHYNHTEKFIDLDAFGMRNNFENLTISLCHKNTLSTILLHIGKCYSGVTKIKLSNNNIELCDGLLPLKYLNNLKELNLSHNKLKSLNDLEFLTGKSNITDVWLEGNPFNENLQLTYDYLNEIQKIFTNLNILDGEVISKQCIFLPTKQNYVCDLDAKDFVESFVKHYFKIYDSVQRSHLMNIYHPNAIFSMSSYFGSEKMSKDKQVRYNQYSLQSRNIVRMTNFCHSHVSVYVGNNNIIKLFNDLSNTEHDLSSFCVDTTAFNSDYVCLIIHGVFKDHGILLNDNEIYFEFSRTFILKAHIKNKGLFGGSTEFRIINEQLHINTLSSRLTMDRFNPKTEITEEEKVVELTQEDKIEMIAIYNKITELNMTMCKRILDDSEWNFQIALELFEIYVKEQKITNDSFN